MNPVTSKHLNGLWRDGHSRLVALEDKLIRRRHQMNRISLDAICASREIITYQREVGELRRKLRSISRRLDNLTVKLQSIRTQRPGDSCG
jgi:predicted  nucleic acid-binding Zn-ribbon protein